MAQFYTLDEAARVLSITPEVLKAKAQSREVRAFLDRGSWRFRVVDIDELARRQGLGSDAELPLSDLEAPIELSDTEQTTDILDLSDFQFGVVPADLTSRSDEFSAPTKPAAAQGQEGASDSNYHVFLDDLALPSDPVVSSSSVLTGMSSVFTDLDDPALRGSRGLLGKAKDQDPFLTPPEPDQSKGVDLVNPPGDSDVLLVSPDSSTPSSVDSDVQWIADELSSSDSWEIPSEPIATEGSSSSEEIEAFAPDSRALRKPSGDRGFESSGPFMVSAWGSQDGLGGIPVILAGALDARIAGQDVAAGGFSQSIDSGLSPEQTSGLDLGLESIVGLDSIIGLAPLREEETSPRPPSTKQPLPGLEDLKKAPAARVPTPPAQTPTPPAETPTPAALMPTPAASRIDEDSHIDSDFDLSLSAIVRDHDDPTVLEDEESDFELGQLDSGSEIFAVEEDEGVDQNAATATTASVDFDEDEEDDETELPTITAATQTAGSRETLSSIASELLASQPGREHRRVRVPSLMTTPSDLEYTGLTVGLLSMAALIMIFAAFVANDLAHYEGFLQDGWTGSGLIRQIAGLFGG